MDRRRRCAGLVLGVRTRTTTDARQYVAQGYHHAVGSNATRASNEDEELILA